MNKVDSILYVEDEKGIQEELSEVVGFFCKDLYLANNGVEGLELYKKHKPDLIISDIKMPNMNGLDMAKAIKDINNEAIIIFTTAFSDTEFLQEAIELQVDGYILKPVDLDLLQNKIESIIRNIQMKKELFRKEQMLIQQSKLAAMGEMMSNIAHQWRQPLNNISLNINNIRLDYDLGQEVEKETILKCSQGVSEQVQYLSQTIDNFREFFLPYTENKEFNIKRFIDKCTSLVKASFYHFEIETIEDVDDKINLYGDANQLLQALINILNNAKDALKNAQKLQKKLIFIVSAKVDHGNVLITIKDNAGGIPEDIISKVFEPYFTTKHQNQGTGLGLYITHTIITHNLKGKIDVNNETFEFEGEMFTGARFDIILPLTI